MKPGFFLACLLFGLATPAPATPDQSRSVVAEKSQTRPEPKLIVAIAVDQFSADLFAEYRSRFTQGLKRMENGIVFPSGYQSHAATETCPGHSTILTGSRPARTGIIANSWMDPTGSRPGPDGKRDYSIYCAEDPSAQGSNSTDYIASSKQLKVPTIGDRLKIASPQSRVIAVSGKDRAAMMLGGQYADLKLYWNGEAFVGVMGKGARMPAAVKVANDAAVARIAQAYKPVLPPFCASRLRAIEVATGATVGVSKVRQAGDAKGWRATPDFDSAAIDLALDVQSELRLGEGAAIDILAIGLSATDYIGHIYGTEGPETCAQLLALDATLGRLFAALDNKNVPYLVVLTADHGGHDAAERNQQQGLPAAQRVSSELFPDAVGRKLASQFGLSTIALLGDGPSGDIYLSAAVPKHKRSDVLAAAVAAYKASSQVEAVFTRPEIEAAPTPSGSIGEWSLLTRVRQSYDPERSGDFVVLLKPYITPIADGRATYTATHGSVWNYDRRVPILFWWPGVAPFEQPNGIETVDILPTLASVIRLNVPSSEIDGRCIDLQAGSDTNCP